MLGLCDTVYIILEACTLECGVTAAIENNASRVLVPSVLQ